MTLSVCLDDRNGLRFHHRRQSRDRAVLRDLAAPVYIDKCSEALLTAENIPFLPAPADLTLLPPEGNFFLEDRFPETVVPLARKVVIYRWNRHYPGDVYWNIDLESQGFSLREKSEFPGSSHKIITREVYER